MLQTSNFHHFNKHYLLLAICIFTLFINPSILSAQHQFGWYVYKGDSLKVEVFHEGRLRKTVGTYPNKQKKYVRYAQLNQIQDTVSYYSKNGDLTSKVCYENLTYELIDSSYLQNYTFIDSCHTIAKQQIAKCFSQTNAADFFKTDFSSSQQCSPKFSRYSIVNSKLYEPVDYNLNECNFLFHSKPDTTQHPYSRFLFHFRFDSTMKIVQSEIDINKSYALNYDIDYAREIMEKFKFKNLKRKGTPKAIKITGPYLKIRQKQFYWIIKRTAGKMNMYSNFDHFVEDNYSEVLEINVETGEYKKALKFTGIIE